MAFAGLAVHALPSVWRPLAHVLHPGLPETAGGFKPLVEVAAAAAFWRLSNDFLKKGGGGTLASSSSGAQVEVRRPQRQSPRASLTCSACVAKW